MLPESLANLQKRLSDISQRMEDLEAGRIRGHYRQAATIYKQTKNLKSDPAGDDNSKAEKLNNLIQEAENVRVRSNPVLSFGEHLDSLVSEKSKEHGVDERLIRAVIQTESGGRTDAVSPKGAVGLMQLMPSTAKELGVNPAIPEENLDGGIRYLKELASRFDSLDEVLAAYNAGPGAVSRFNGIPPYRETQEYIKRVRARLADFRM